MKHSISFTLKGALCFLVCTLLLVITIVTLFIPEVCYKKLYEKRLEELCKIMVNQGGLELSDVLADFDQRIDEMIWDSDLRELVFNSESHSIEDYYDIIKLYFNEKGFDTSYLYSIDLYVRSSGAYYQSDGTSPVIQDVFDSMYYKIGLVYPNTLNWVNYDKDLDCLEISRVIYDAESYMAEGLLILRLSPMFLLDNFNVQGMPEMKQIYIVDELGKILSSGAVENIGKNVNDFMVSVPSTPFLGVFDNGDNVIVYCHMSEISYIYPCEEWTVIVEIEKEALLVEYNKISNMFLGIAAVLIIIALATTMWFAGFLSRPLMKLAHAMSEVRHENLGYYINEKFLIKEIETVNRGFNGMSGQLDNLINNVYQSQLVQKEAQLQKLQAQINPHFLFNTLQLIGWKAHEYEAEPVCEMIYSLSYMLETDLHSEDKNFFALEEELNYIYHYSNIIRYKYGGKIEIVIDVPDELRDCKVPKILLQPFIENAVVHGLASKISPGHVFLKIFEENGDLVAIIRDDGVGITPEVLSGLKTNGKVRSSDFGDSHHIALKNIRSRIWLLYGEEYGFSIVSERFEGTTITVRIPLNRYTYRDA